MGKKVFILNHGLANGGTDTFTINLSKGLKDRNYDVSVVMAVYPDSEPQPREHVLKEAGIPIYKTSDLVGIKGVFDHSRRLYKILRQNKPDVFHANMDLFNGINMLTAWLARVPVRVCHSHTTQSQFETNTGKHLATNIYRSIMRLLCRMFANRYCGCSSQAMGYLFKDNWKNDPKAKIIYNGIDLTLFESTEKPDNNSNNKTLVTVGRISKTKNPYFIINIIDHLRIIRKDFIFLWVGDGELFEKMKTIVKEKELESFITFTGNQSNIPEILKKCDLFIFPSLFEGLGISLIEAQASGLYSLASTAVPEDVDCGLCEFLPIDSPDLWVSRISDLLDNGSKKTVDKTALQKFDISTMISEIEKVYNQ